MRIRWIVPLLIAGGATAQELPPPPKPGNNPVAAPRSAPEAPKPAPESPAPVPPPPAKLPAARSATPRASAAGAVAAPSYKDLKYAPLRQVEIPNVESFTLPNGMKVYLLEDHELPVINGFALVRTGNLFDPPDKIGLAGIAGEVIRSGGTRAATGDQLDEKLEDMAASVEAGIGETSGRISFNALKENALDVLQVFHDVLTEPDFRADKVELARTQMKGVISRRNDDASGIVAREFESVLYGRDNPYGWSMEYDHINRISREDLLAFHKRYFFPANIMLAVYGDFQTADMKARLEKLFEGWTASQPTVPPFPPVTQKAKPGVYFAEKTDVTQTFFAIGHLGGMYKDKDYPALEVMADILGGGFRSRLFNRVRTEKGYAYSIGASWTANFIHPGRFEISGSTKSLSTTETFKLIEEEVKRLRDSGVTEAELTTARQAVLNSFVFNFDTRAKTLSRLMTYEYFGYPKDFIFQYQKAIAAVTRADIQRVARERLHPEEMAFVAVGNPADFVQPLESLGKPVTKLDLTIPEPKIEAAAGADPASLQRGKQLLERAQQVVGGADRLAAIKDASFTSQVQLDASAGGLKAKVRTRWLQSGHFRQEVELPFGKLTTYSDGASGWTATMQGDRPLVGNPMKQARGYLFRAYAGLLLSDRNPGRTVNSPAENVIEITGKEGESVRIAVEPSTGLPVRESYNDGQANLEEALSDYREIGGVKFPFKIEIFQNGKKFSEAVFEEVKVNSGATAEELKKHP